MPDFGKNWQDEDRFQDKVNSLAIKLNTSFPKEKEKPLKECLKNLNVEEKGVILRNTARY